MIIEWEKIVGHDKMKTISNEYFDKRLNLEFPDFQEDNFKYKKLSISSKIENNANMLREFEKKGLLTQDEVSRMIEVSTRNIIDKNISDTLFKNVSLMLDDEIMKTIKNKLKEIEGKGFLTHEEVSIIVREISGNITGETKPGELFEYVCILLDEERIRDQDERLELVIRYIKENLKDFEPEEERLE